MIQFGFCDLAVIPVRRDPSDKSEMSTQLLFGDLIEIHEQSGPWLMIKNFADGYEGWIDAKQVRQIDQEEYERLTNLPVFVNRHVNADRVEVNGELVMLPAGCSFYGLESQVMRIGGEEYLLKGKAFPFEFSEMGTLLETAYSYLSSPYLWGGKTYMGLDCSGLIQVVYKQHGISLSRDASQQAKQGELVSFISDSLPGDLAYFDDAEGNIVHVGILLDNQHIMHCSGKVRIDTIDHQGIYNHDLNKYTHNLRLIRRVVSS